VLGPARLFLSERARAGAGRYSPQGRALAPSEGAISHQTRRSAEASFGKNARRSNPAQGDWDGLRIDNREKPRAKGGQIGGGWRHAWKAGHTFPRGRRLNEEGGGQDQKLAE